jgi:hypothetical protein
MYIGFFMTLMWVSYSTAGRDSFRRYAYWGTLSALFLFSAYRFEVGCDWTGYWFQYELQYNAGLAEALTRREPLWWAMVELMHRLELSYLWLNLISSGIFFLGVHAFAKRQPDPLAFLILLFPILILNMPMSGIRQGAAIGILFFAFNAYMDRSLVRFLVFTALASTIHNSSLIMLALTPLLVSQSVVVRVPAAIALGALGVFLLSYSEITDVAIVRYVESDLDSAGAAFRLLTLFGAALMFFVLLRKSWKQDYPKDYEFMLVSAIAMLLLPLALLVSSVIADRLGYFFIAAQAAMFARIPYLSRVSMRTIAYVLPHVGLLLFLGTWIVLSRHFNECYVPYQTWLFGMPPNTKLPTSW